MISADTKTALKLWLMWGVILAGEVVIFADTWRRVDGRYASEGLITEALMSVIMGGIPGVAFAGVVYVALAWLAFKPGEIEAYRLRRTLAAASAPAQAAKGAQAKVTKAIEHDD